MIEHLCRVVEEMHGLSDGHWIVNLEESSHIYLSIYIYICFLIFCTCSNSPSWPVVALVSRVV